MNIKKVALFWLALIIFPAFVILSLYVKLSDVGLLTYLGFIIASETAIFAGYGLNFLIHCTKITHEWKINTISLCIGTIASFGFHYVFNKIDLVFIIAIFAVYFLGVRLYNVPYEKIAGNVFYSISLFLYIIVGFSLKSDNTNKYIIIFMCSVMMLSTFILIFLKNRINVSSLMKNRNYNEKYLSQYSEKYNNRFVAVLCLIFSVALIFRKAIIYIYHIILTIFKYILRFLLNLFSSSDVENEIINEGTSQNDIPTPSDSGNGILKYVFTIIIIAAVIFIAVRYRRDILSAAEKAYISIRRKFEYLFTKRSEPVRKIVHDGYTDIDEDIFSEKPVSRNKKASVSKSWKKNIMKYKSINNNENKFRFGYGLILFRLEMSGKKKKASETANETAENLNSSSFTKLTEAYNPIRYGEYKCSDESISQLDSTLDNIQNVIN